MSTSSAPSNPPAINSSSAHWKGLFVGVIVLLATIICSAVLHHRAMEALKNEVQDKLLRTARTIAAQIDGDLHTTFTNREQESTPDYNRALIPLRRALYWREASGEVRNDYRFAYTCVLVGDEVRFVLDATPPGLTVRSGVDEKSHIMQAYPDASARLRSVLLTGQAQADTEPYTDEWGTFVSGYAPIFDFSHKLVGAVGVDWFAQTYAARLAGIRQAWYLQIVLCLASGFLSGVGTGIAMVRRERAESARRHAVEEAERNRRRWRIMVETLPKPAAHLENGELWINDPLVRVLGCPRVFLNTPDAWFRRLFGDRAAAARADYESDRAQGFRHTRELQVRHADGQFRWIELTSHSYEPGEVWLIEDITERREQHAHLIETRLAAESAAEAKGAFLANVSHEIRTPMNGVIGMTQLLLDSPLDPNQQEMVETIRSSGETLVVLINDILDYSKIESGNMQVESAPFALRSAIEDCVHLFAARAAEKGIHLVSDIAHDCPTNVLGDTNRFRQILCNLINNAVKFTPGGEIVISVTSVPAPAGIKPASPAVEGLPIALQIDIRDTGIGIPPDRIDCLFKSFSQADTTMARRFGGTGLGLAIARRLAELMQGSLELVSTSALGSTFRFTFVTWVEPSTQPDLFAPRKDFAGHTVLQVQPHAPTAAVIASYLKRWGLECVTVTNAVQAIDLLRNAGPYSALIADIQLSNTDGLALARQIQEISLDLRPHLFLLTPVLSEDLNNEARARGVIQLLVKPLRPVTLLVALDSVLGAPRSPATLQSAPDAAQPVRNLNILVAEDNAVNQLVVRRLLERLGYSPNVVCDGRAALEAVRKSPVDLIFMDVQMPVMNGYEATRLIRALAPPIRQPWIIALTANALEGDRVTALAQGMDDYLSKPLRLPDLERVL
ncbi:MAG: Signal transduction histidine-protein kinase BarA, partial [Verrucomicrobiota bacterium]